MASPASRVLGQLLLAAGAVTQVRLAEALAEQRRTGERVGEVLIRGGVPPEQIARALATQLRIPYEPPPLRPEAEAVRLVERGLARRHRVCPLALRNGRLRVAMADPLDVAALDDLAFQTGRRLEPAVSVPDAVLGALAAAYEGSPRGGGSPAPGNHGTSPTGNAGEGPEEVALLLQASEAAPVVAVVEDVLRRAAAVGCSDVHLEPSAEGLGIRVRVDGELRPLLQLPRELAPAVTSRIKIMAGLDIAVKRRPQDGRSSIRAGTRALGLRVSTLPSKDGEKVVLRLLDPRNAGVPLADAGFDPLTLRRLRRLLQRSHGALLVTGPTGSGKTTTLYGILGEVDRERRNVVTLEDPVEYRLPGVTQVQVHPQAGLTFASGLRAVLRQDPDVVMVGELRDAETVEVCMAAALTGHVVLSTLHTNDATGAVTRLVEMGAPPYLVAGSLMGVLAQRLVRRLCPACRVADRAEPEDLAVLGLPASVPVTVFRAEGCEACSDTGYAGRTGLFELLVLSTAVRRGVLAGLASDELRETSRAEGMIPLSHDAWTKVRAGITTLEEVRPHLALLADEAPVCSSCGGAVAAGYRACPRCGAAQGSWCRCGRRLEGGWTWCPGCGGPLGRLTPGDSDRPDAGAAPPEHRSAYFPEAHAPEPRRA